jgi:hypothetical protein
MLRRAQQPLPCHHASQWLLAAMLLLAVRNQEPPVQLSTAVRVGKSPADAPVSSHKLALSENEDSAACHKITRRFRRDLASWP